MSATDALLLFVDAGNEIEGWLRLRRGAVVARGAGVEGMPAPVDAETGDPLRLIAAVPGEAVSLHWLEVPAGLAPAQAAAAARLMASEVSAQPLADMHVAVGREAEDSPVRTVALVPGLAMAGWIGALQSRGFDPDIILPEPLLLPPPGEGFVRYHRGAVPLYRGPTDAFAIEPELAELMVAGAAVTDIDDAGFEDGLGEAIASAPVNLRQGAFAKRRRWKLDWPLIRRLLLLGLAILLVTLAIQLAAIMRYTFAADALELEAKGVAAQVLPGTTPAANAPAQLEQRLADLRGSGVGYSAIATSLFDAIRATANVELTAMLFDRDGSLRATVQADSPASIAALGERIEAAGFAVEVGPMRMGGGRQTAEIVVRAQ